MFYGAYRHAVDEKGRLAIPVRFRHRLDGGAMLARGREACLVIYPATEWAELTRQLQYSSRVSPTFLEYMRTVFPHSQPVDFDAQGRLLLAPEERQYAAIARGAVVVGMNNVIEIFGEEEWNARQAAHDAGTATALAEAVRAELAAREQALQGVGA